MNKQEKNTEKNKMPTVAFEFNEEQVDITDGIPTKDGYKFNSIGEMIATAYGGAYDGEHISLIEALVENGIGVDVLKNQILESAGDLAYHFTGGNFVWRDEQWESEETNFGSWERYIACVPNVSARILEMVWDRVFELEKESWGHNEYPDFYEKNKSRIIGIFQKALDGCDKVGDFERVWDEISTQLGPVFDGEMKKKAIPLIQEAVKELYKEQGQ